MQYKVRLAEIPFFNFVNPSFAKKLVTTFSIVKKNKGDLIVEYGSEVPGFYLLAEGAVDVYAQKSNILITTLQSGSTFGEMSLIEDEDSSATLKAASDDTILLLCKKELFSKLLAEDFVFAAAFYRGAALILSKRLRNTNFKVEEEMEKGRTVIRDMVDSDGIIAKLGHTQGSLNVTGENMIQKLSDLLPTLDVLSTQISDTASIDQLKATIKNVLTIDSQNFDIISQQMDQINQHLINIQRLMSGLDIHDVKGDSKIFEVQHERTAEDEDAITFF